MSTEVAEESTDKKDSSDEVEIKEEPAEVVEISSEDEKPRIEDLPGNYILFYFYFATKQCILCYSN